MASLSGSPALRCEELQLRLAETEEQLASKEEAASVVLDALAEHGDPDQAERRKQLARVAHREAVRAAEHAAALRRRMADRPHRDSVRSGERGVVHQTRDRLAG